jgi:hypothetical protein
LKLKKESGGELIMAMMRFIIVKRKKLPKKWKTGKMILIFKEGEESDPGNWRPITFTSVISRIIFGRL